MMISRKVEEWCGYTALLLLGQSMSQSVTTTTSLLPTGESRNILDDVFSPANTIIIAIAGSAVGALIIGVIVFCLIRNNRRRRQRQSSSDSKQSPLQQQKRLKSAGSSQQKPKSNKQSASPQVVVDKSANRAENATLQLQTKQQDVGFEGTIYDATIVQTVTAGTMYNADAEAPLNIPGFLQIDITKDVDKSKVIAQGGFGEVYEGLLLSENIRARFPRINRVAIKLIKPPQSISEEENRIVFDQEVALMWHFDGHPNFIQLVGYSHQPLVTVTKLYEFGSLANLIYGKKSIPNMKYNFYLVLKLGEDIASALFELHSRKIAHNDVKPDNVLIDFDYLQQPVGVICDFSISSVHSEELLGVKAFRKSQLEGASIHYCPPELLMEVRNDPLEKVEKIPLAVDVYAFGLLLFEMATRKHPWHKMPQGEIINAVCAGKRPHIPAQIVEMAAKNPQTSFMLELISRCWNQDPAQRPSIAEIKGKLMSINNSLQSRKGQD
ncbi:hypothetical protein MP228_004121 [Amoeboaphelidium protococcarum]|nr:hypothetical protein MP228_004121 [Amoeboaphelidium protococcarum]